MKSRSERTRLNAGPDEPFDNEQPQHSLEDLETEPELDEDELDETELQDPDDDRWDVFLLDDEGELMPERSDFWIPD